MKKVIPGLAILKLNDLARSGHPCCMVGETRIISAAGVRFLEAVPGIRFCEGCFGPLLLREDVTPRSLRFGLGGRPPKLGRLGWGITVEEDRLRRACVDRPVVLAL